jgi:hypothetical protein
MNVRGFMEKSLKGMREHDALGGCENWPPLAVYACSVGTACGFVAGLLVGVAVVGILWAL